MAKRTAKLQTGMTADPKNADGLVFWLRLRGKNGELQMTSETYPTRSNAKRARGQCLESFADVLRAEGWTVEPPEVKP